MGSEGSKMLTECYQNTLLTIVNNYHRLEKELSENIAILREDQNKNNFAEFLGHEPDSPDKNSLSFNEKTASKRDPNLGFLNKNYGNEHALIKIRLEMYFKNVFSRKDTKMAHSHGASS